MSARSLLMVAAVAAAACGGVRPEVVAQDPEPTPRFTTVDEQMDLTDEERAALAETGSHSEGPLQGLSRTCRLAEQVGSTQPVGGPDDQSVGQIVAEIEREVARGPLVAVDATEGSVVVATTLMSADGSVGDTAAWAVDTGADRVTAANSLAADLTSFELVPIATAGEGRASSALAEATDCSWVLADVTHADPPEPEPQMRPELLVLEPQEAVPGQLVAMHFPEETPRGVAFQLDMLDSEGWVPVAWMTSDGNGGEPVTVPVSTEGYGVVDVGVAGPGPDHVRLPGDVPPGDYRICTANAGDEFCAPLEVVNG